MEGLWTMDYGRPTARSYHINASATITTTAASVANNTYVATIAVPKAGFQTLTFMFIPT